MQPGEYTFSVVDHAEPNGMPLIEETYESFTDALDRLVTFVATEHKSGAGTVVQYNVVADSYEIALVYGTGEYNLVRLNLVEEDYALSDCANWETNTQGDCAGRVWPSKAGVILCETCHNR